jgi:hypothetical protein
MLDMEDFFKPISDALEPLLNPIAEVIEEVETSGVKGKDAKKEEAKKPPPKAAKPVKGGGAV